MDADLAGLHAGHVGRRALKQLRRLLRHLDSERSVLVEARDRGWRSEMAMREERRIVPGLYNRLFPVEHPGRVALGLDLDARAVGGAQRLPELVGEHGHGAVQKVDRMHAAHALDRVAVA